MRYQTTPSFERSLRGLDEFRKERVKKAVQLLAAFFETGQLPHGLGMKPLRHEIWEVRAGTSDRILFHRNRDVIQFLLVGSHNEVSRYLKNY